MFVGTYITAVAQNVTGKVTDSTGKPIVGVVVLKAGTQIGTFTGNEGEYSLDAAPEDKLSFSFIGYESTELSVGTRSVINVVMEYDAMNVDEVVVIGYGTKKRSDLTGALSTVDTQDLMEQNRTSLSTSLQGLIPGVDVVMSSNKPGYGANIMIRGQNTISSLASGDDNIQDGINQPLVVINGMYGDLNDINPADVERIDILKDASSTAIYGSRGANGVILVTTKKGVSGRTKVEFNASVGVKSATNLPDMLSAEEYVQYRIDRDKTQYWSDSSYSPGLESLLGAQAYSNYMSGKSVDWVNEVLQTGMVQNYSFQISGGNEATTYSLSAAYTDEEGLIANDAFTRYNFSTNIDRKVNNYLKAGMNLMSAYSVSTSGGTETLRSAYRLSPLGDIYDDDGSYRLYPCDQNTSVTNPLLEMNEVVGEATQLRSLGNAYIELTPVSWLKITSTFTPDIKYYKSGEYRGVNSKTAKGDQSSTRAYSDSSSEVKYTWDNVIYGEHKIGDHSFNGTLGSSWYRYQGDGTGIEMRSMTNDDYLWYNLGSGLTKQSVTSYYTQEQLMSYFARFNYDYKNRYLFTVTGRYDGSSKLAEGNKWKFFPSAAAAWKISEENFMQDAKFVNNLKLRLSYGVSGNNGIGAYTSAQSIGNSAYMLDNSISTTAYINGFANNSLTWESTHEYDLGVDFALFDYRLTGSVDFYNRLTKDILMSRVMSQMNGASAVTDNVGEVLNRGIELSLTGAIVRTKDFDWNVTVNFSKNHNEITALYDGLTEDKNNGWFVGESVGAVYAYEVLGFWGEDEAEEAAKYGVAPGSVKLNDVNGDYVFDNDDKTILGSYFPKWTGSITSTFRYKNFDLTVNAYTRQGQYSYSQFHRHFGGIDNVEFNVVNMDYWTTENTDGTWARPGSTGYYDAQYYMETSFVKIGHITLGCTLPERWLEKIGMSKARLSVACQNPFTFSDYEGWDPELAGQNTYNQAPMSRNIIFSMNISF